MRLLIFPALFILWAAPLAYAASDCERNCCRNHTGSWDDDFMDCRGEKAGYDTCVSDCDARVWASMPQGPGPADPEHTYTCKVGAILLCLLAAAVLMARRSGPP